MTGAIPDYRNPDTGGAMVRAACWLASEIGEGGTFTKEQLRAALPGISQIDRRVRDLRQYGWIIEEYRDAPGLPPSQQRLVRIGARVWIPDERRAAEPQGISARVLERDGYMCVYCGAARGSEIPGYPGSKARLSAAHLYPKSLGGAATEESLVTACQMCNEALQAQTPSLLDVRQLWERARRLPRSDRQKLLARITTSRRERSPLDEIWSGYLRLPGVAREEFVRNLEASLQPAGK